MKLRDHPARHLPLLALATILALTLTPSPRAGAAPQDAHDSRDEEALPPLAPGEKIQSESWEIDEGGKLTYLRSLQRKVGFLGAEVRTLEREAAERLKIAPFQGVLVVSVDREGPLALAGAARDDVIVRYAEEPIRSRDQFAYLVEETPPGAAVKLSLLRDAVQIELQAVAGEASRISSSRAVTRSLPLVDDWSRTGMKLAEVTGEVAPLLYGGGPTPRGLVVVKILPGGPAFFSAARRGDLLVEAGGQSISTGADYQARLEGGGRVRLALLRKGQRVETEIAPERNADREREVNIPVLFRYSGGPKRQSVKLLWGLLFHARRSHHVQGGWGDERHVSERDWDLLLDLVDYHGDPDRHELRLLWILPFRW